MLYNVAVHALKNDGLKRTKMIQPDQAATKHTTPRLRRRSRTPRHDRRLSWRRNYMVTSMPSQVDEVIEPDSLKRADFHSFTQSLHRHTGKEISRELRRKRLLKLLRDCAESMESLACKSYVESMRSCASSESSMYGHTIDSSQDLIILEDAPDVTGLAAGNSVLQNKHLSEIVLRDHDRSAGNGDNLYASTDNATSNRYRTSKLHLGNSFCSSYVGDSDVSASPSEAADISAKLASNRWMAAGPVVNRKDRYARLNEDDYRDLVANGKSTAFLSQNDEELSLYYDDEFDVEHSPLGPLHDSGLEAAICNQYASLLRTARGGDVNQQSANSSDVHSNFSSDFENIFPASLSLLHPEVDDGEAIEEMSELDRSVPNYANMPAVTKKDYQLTFTHTESLYSDARSMCDPSSLDSEYVDLAETNSNRDRPEKVKITKTNQVPKPPRGRTEQWHTADPSISAKKVSFSDELVAVEEPQKSHAQRMEEIGNSTTWQEMKKNYTTWGQIKSDRAEDKKSHSLGDMRLQEDLVDAEEIDIKPHSLTLWEMYKRTHSLSLSELNSCETSIPPAAQPTQQADKTTEDLAKSINDLLDDALKGPETEVDRKPPAGKFDLPDLSFLREDKNNMTKHNWWREVFDQPSFCTPGASRTSSVRTCSHCDRRHSTDQQVILFQGSKPAQYKMCELSMLEQLVVPPTQCKCATREKLCDLSSGIATGSSGVTPREPNSWQHIADFLKRRQKNTDVNSRGSQNSTLSDQQLLDVIACVEAADNLVKCQQSGVQETGHDTLLQIWKLVSALECVLGMGLKSHKLVTVPMGKIRTRVSIWDIVEESSTSAGKLTSTFSQIISEISKYQLNDASIKFCLFIVGLMNNQCLDFWLSILTHNKELMDKYYNDDSYLRSKVIADRKLYTEMVQALQHLSLFTWDIDYKNLITACTQTALTAEKGQDETPSRTVNYRQSTASANQQKVTPNFGKTQRYYSANNIRQAILI